MTLQYLHAHTVFAWKSRQIFSFRPPMAMARWQHSVTDWLALLLINTGPGTATVHSTVLAQYRTVPYTTATHALPAPCPCQPSGSASGSGSHCHGTGRPVPARLRGKCRQSQCRMFIIINNILSTELQTCIIPSNASKISSFVSIIHTRCIYTFKQYAPNTRTVAYVN